MFGFAERAIFSLAAPTLGYQLTPEVSWIIRVLARTATRTPGAVYRVWYIRTPCLRASAFCMESSRFRAPCFRFSVRFATLVRKWHSVSIPGAESGRGDCSAVTRLYRVSGAGSLN